MKTRTTSAVGTSIIFLTLLASACSSDTDSAARIPGETPWPEPTQKDAISVLVGSPGEWRKLSIGPAGALEKAAEQSTSRSTQLRALSLELGSEQITGVGANFEADGWLLVRAAAIECGMIQGGLDGIHPAVSARSPVTPGASTTGWYIIPDVAIDSLLSGTCDDQLAYEELLLCVADKLGEVAESPDAITWERLALAPAIVGATSQPWTIPPQSPRVRYIARDLAIDVIAHLAALDTTKLYSAPEGQLCTDAYGTAATDTIWGSEYIDSLLTVDSEDHPVYFPPDLPTRVPEGGFDHENVLQIVQSRLAFRAQVLRASSRLLKDLTESGVKADIAGATSYRGTARDSVAANQVGWGLNPEGSYNSYAHAVRTVAGRWNIASPDKPSGVAPLEILPAAYGVEIDARTQDVEIRTEEMRLALAIVRKSGVVYKPNGSTRALVLDHLVHDAAEARGLDAESDTEPAMKFERRTIEALVARVSDAQLEAAAEKVWREYRLMMNLGPKAEDVDTALAGMELSTYQSTNLAAAKGRALKRGLPQCQAALDPIATAGGVLAASQKASATAGEEGLAGDKSGENAYQDAYSLAQALRQRLIAIREVAPADSDSHRTASLGAAETSKWAGSGRISVVPQGTATEITSLDVYLIGLSTEELYGTKDDDVRGARSTIRLVYGKAWQAECATGMRMACPPNAETFVWPVAVSEEDKTQSRVDWKRHYGADGVVRKLRFTNVNAEYSRNALDPNRLYVVQTRTPRATTGRVLAALALRGPNFATTAPVSPAQARHLSNLLTVSARSCRRHDLIGGLNWAVPDVPCVEGIDANAPIPLENDLTSDGDAGENSYRHYLAIAERDAAYADELGRQLIQYGIQRDERREASQRKLGEECGDYAGSMEQTDVTAGGDVTTSDPTLSQCFDSNKIDIVLLGRKPKELLEEENKGTAAALAYIRDKYLNCGASNANEYCDKTRDFTYDALGLESVDSSIPPDQPRCDAALAAVESLSTKFIGFANVGAEEYASRDSLRNALVGLRMVVNKDLSWTLIGLGGPLMDSEKANFWPGCLRSGSKSLTDCGGPYAYEFNQLYRQGGATKDSQGNWVLKALGSAAGEYDPVVASRVLLWRVQGSVATLAALAGAAPSGLFSTPVPAAVLPADGSLSAPLMTVFNRGEWFEDADPATEDWSLSAPAADQLSASPITSFWPDLPQVPFWIRSVYNAGVSPTYLNVAADSDAIQFPEYPAGNYAWLQMVSKGLEGITCTSGLEGGAYNQAVWDVSSMKRGVSGEDPFGTWGNVCFWELQSATCDYPGDGCNSKGTLGLRGMPKLRGNGQIDLELDFRNYDAFWWEEDHDCKNGGIGDYWEVHSAMNSHCEDVVGNAIALDSLKAAEVLPTGDQPIALRSIRLDEDGVASHEDDGDSGGYRIRRRSEELLAAHQCSPGARARLMVNFYPPYGQCGAASEVAQALGLACYLRHGGITVAEPPELKSESSITQLVLWLESQALTIKRQVGRLHIEKVPARVVKDFHSRKSGSGSLNGKQAEHVLDMERGLNDIVAGLNDTSAQLQAVSGAIDGARVELELADLKAREASIKLALNRLEFEHAVVIGAAQAAGGVISAFTDEGHLGASLTSAAAAGTNVYYAAKQKEIQDQLVDAQAEQDALAVDRIMVSLSQQVAPAYSAIQNSISRLADGAAAVSLAGHKLEQGEDAAKFELAAGSGADYVKMGDGQYVKFPVNTALRRQYDLTRLRYLEALKRAKYSAYVARLAIEQRIGVRLTEFREPLGPCCRSPEAA